MEFDQELRYCENQPRFSWKTLTSEFIYSPEIIILLPHGQGSSVAIEHFYKYVESYLTNRNVEVFIDIGANDNLMLKKFKKSGVNP